jgi:hypothetical protein
MTPLEEQFPLLPDTEYDGWWSIDGKVHHLSIHRRPTYCDRGRFQVDISPVAGAGYAYSIDDSDGFPRYFMNFDRMMDELREWLDWRENGGAAKAGREAFSGSVEDTIRALRGG